MATEDTFGVVAVEERVQDNLSLIHAFLPVAERFCGFFQGHGTLNEAPASQGGSMSKSARELKGRRTSGDIALTDVGKVKDDWNHVMTNTKAALERIIDKAVLSSGESLDSDEMDSDRSKTDYLELPGKPVTEFQDM